MIIGIENFQQVILLKDTKIEIFTKTGFNLDKLLLAHYAQNCV